MKTLSSVSRRSLSDAAVVGVGVEAPGEAEVGLLHLGFAGRARDAEHLEVIPRLQGLLHLEDLAAALVGRRAGRGRRWAEAAARHGWTARRDGGPARAGAPAAAARARQRGRGRGTRAEPAGPARPCRATSGRTRRRFRRELDDPRGEQARAGSARCPRSAAGSSPRPAARWSCRRRARAGSRRPATGSASGSAAAGRPTARARDPCRRAPPGRRRGRASARTASRISSPVESLSVSSPTGASSSSGSNW